MVITLPPIALTDALRHVIRMANSGYKDPDDEQRQAIDRLKELLEDLEAEDPNERGVRDSARAFLSWRMQPRLHVL